MKNTNYKKINLRNFRHNLTQLKDSFAAGQIYEVEEKGDLLGYFVPKGYTFILKKEVFDSNESERDFVKSLRGKFELKEPTDDYKKLYHKLLVKKYLKK
jgi:hypothetical protein